MTTYTVPHHLTKIHEELLAAGMSTDVLVLGDGDELTLDGEFDAAVVEPVIDGHDPTPPPAPADPDDEFRAAVEAATSIADLKAALLGTTGPGAEARHRV